MHLHKWTKWNDPQPMEYAGEWRPVEVTYVQRRHCTVCNRIQARQIVPQKSMI